MSIFIIGKKKNIKAQNEIFIDLSGSVCALRSTDGLVQTAQIVPDRNVLESWDIGIDYSRKIAERMWNLSHKGELESHREETFIDDIIQKSYIERKLLENLDGIHTVFDGGAGCGRFSILLAKHGCKVTHFDISQPMIDKAKELAEKANVLDRITFVRGALEDLNNYSDRSFDMVISFDAPISYTYPNQENVIRDLVRIGKKE